MMMSVERSFEAWEEVQRHGQDLADKLAQGFTGLIQTHITPPSFQWPSPPTPKLFKVEFPMQNFIKSDFGFLADNPKINGMAAVFDIGNKIGQAGADFGACLNGVVHQFTRQLPLPFRNGAKVGISISQGVESRGQDINMGITTLQEDLGSMAEQLKDYGFSENSSVAQGLTEDESIGVSEKALKHLGRSKGTFNVTTTYDSRTSNIESSLLARGDLWRVEASQGSSTSGNENPSLFLFQLGPVLFVRDSTLLLPVHLSKKHLLWYGYDRKSFVDLQFPNGQLTYVSGEGISTSAFLPLCGGLLQAQGQYPGDMKFSFSCKNKWGTRITPTLQWPDHSFALGLDQALAWKRSGLMVRPTVQFSLCPTFGGSCPGLRLELTHSLKEELNLICGCALVAHPSAFASVSVGRSKWNGNVGNSGVVVKVETPLGNNIRPSFSVQLNSGVEF